MSGVYVAFFFRPRVARRYAALMIAALGHTDALTGLLNRTGFAVAAAQQRAMAGRRGEPLALAVIDLDGFKLVNDRGGHAAGDRLLVDLAGVWTASLRPGDLLARFGGDDEESLDEAIERADARLYIATDPRRSATDGDRQTRTVQA